MERHTIPNIIPKYRIRRSMCVRSLFSRGYAAFVQKQSHLRDHSRPGLSRGLGRARGAEIGQFTAVSSSVRSYRKSRRSEALILALLRTYLFVVQAPLIGMPVTIRLHASPGSRTMANRFRWQVFKCRGIGFLFQPSMRETQPAPVWALDTARDCSTALWISMKFE